MPYTKDGVWYPKIFEKQARVANSKKRYVLFSGPRKAGKTLGCAQAVVKHCANTPGARFMVMGSTATVNADGGAWEDLTSEGGAIDQWVEGGQVEWVTRPKVRGLTKKMFCEIQGPAGKSSIQLDSLKVEHEVEGKFKNRRFSGIWITQMDEVIKHRKSFDILRQCLRMTHLKHEDHKFIADVNPPKEGTDSWFYKLWFIFPTMKLPDDMDPEHRKALEEMQKDLEVVSVSIDDNIFLPEKDKREVYSCYCDDPNLLARYYYGKYVKASGDGFFSDVWRPPVHIIGEVGALPEFDEYLVPEENCWELGCGWDYGGRNPAVVFVEPVDVSADPNKPVYTFKVLDELVILNENVPLSDFVEMVMERMDKLEATINEARKERKMEPIPIRWEHFSDSSSFTRYDSIGDTYEYKEVYRYSDGRIEMRAVNKGRNSVFSHMNLVRKLLFQNRIYVDAHCEMLIRMFANLALNRNNRFDRQDEDKHAADALRYYIAGKSFFELESALTLPTAKAADVIAVAL